MAGVFAEFEREMIRERVLSGQAQAKASGVRFGRPTIPADKAAAIVADLKGRRWCRQAREASRRRRWDRPEAQGEAARLGDRRPR
jgi:DNA invertase Pin-like site-specific DNA recombinase